MSNETPGMFRTWKECIIKLDFGLVFMVVTGSLVLWAMGLVHFTGR